MLYYNKKMRRPGIEPGPYDWKSDILPLNYRRIQKEIVSGIFNLISL